MELGTHHEIEYLPGGRIRHTQHLRPIAYHNGNGILKLIANDWVDGDQDSPHVVSAAPMRVRADGGGRRNIYPIPGNDGVYISIGRPWYQPAGGWQVAPMNPLERANNRLQSINAQYNLYLDHAGHFAKMGILLKGGFVPPNSRFAFPVSLVGLTRQGSTILHNGQPVMTLRRPVVYDFANPEDERAIAFNFGAFGSQTGVIFNLPDLAGMSMPVVDPTLTLQPDAADGLDTYLNSSSATTNFGTGTNFRERQADFRSLVKFDLSSIPSNAIISSATYSLWNLFVDATNLTINLHRIKAANSGWTEVAATWDTIEGSTAWAGAAGCSTAGTDYEVTAIGSLAFVGGTPLNTETQVSLNTTQLSSMLLANYGWVGIRPVGGNPTTVWNSSDAASAARRPKLVVEYTLPAGGIFWPGVTLSAVFDGAIVR